MKEGKMEERKWLWSVRWIGVALYGGGRFLILANDRPESAISKARKLLAEMSREDKTMFAARIAEVKNEGFIDAF